MPSMKHILEFEVIDHGIEHAQYFQGCSTYLTKWDFCVTGCGDSYLDAIDDALELLAQSDFDVDFIDEDPEVIEDMKLAEAGPTTDGYSDEHFYYVSIRIVTGGLEAEAGRLKEEMDATSKD